MLVYRLFNFVPVGAPAVIAQRQLEHMFDAKLNPLRSVPDAINSRRIGGRFRSRARR